MKKVFFEAEERGFLKRNKPILPVPLSFFSFLNISCVLRPFQLCSDPDLPENLIFYSAVKSVCPLPEVWQPLSRFFPSKYESVFSRWPFQFKSGSGIFIFSVLKQRVDVVLSCLLSLLPHSQKALSKYRGEVREV